MASCSPRGALVMQVMAPDRHRLSDMPLIGDAV
jgi:hypothetical protein